MKNDLFSIGGFTIHGYGLMIGIGFLAAYLLSDHRAKKKGLDGDHVLGLGMWVIVIGLAGAKFLYYITTIDEIIKDPRLLLDIANGFVVYGGIIGGILGGYAYCRKYRLDFLKYADLILHVADASNPQMDEQMYIVYETLKSLQVTDKPVITVFNKQDKVEDDRIIRDFHADYTVKISARTGMGIPELLETVEAVLREQKVFIEKLYSYQEAGKIQLIRKYGNLELEEYTEEGIFVRAAIPSEYVGQVM